MKNVNESPRWLPPPHPAQSQLDRIQNTRPGTVGPRAASKARAVQDLPCGDSAPILDQGLQTRNIFNPGPFGM